MRCSGHLLTHVHSQSAWLIAPQKGGSMPFKGEYFIPENVGLGDAAKRGVGTGANQIPDMSSWTSGAGWRRTPDGIIEQWGIVQILEATVETQVVFPISFIKSCEDVQLTYSPANINATTYSVSVKHTSLSKTGCVIGGNSAGNTSVRYKVIGR